MAVDFFPLVRSYGYKPIQWRQKQTKCDKQSKQYYRKVKLGNDQEMAQSERNSQYKNQGGIINYAFIVYINIYHP